ncbi:MAG: tetratricopeptide repeat protein [Gemmataceae bacterium]|nr:tetratricopeptide repeat protein [Gemmataceae bacterium]
MSRSRRRFLGLLGLTLVAVLLGAAAVWRYRTLRPEDGLRQGQEALLRSDVARAEQMAQRLESAGYPDHAHALRGHIFLRAGQLPQAILEYNQIPHEQTELLADISLVYGLGFLSLGQPVEAERFLLYVASIYPDNRDAHRGLATIYYDRGAMTDALGQLIQWSELEDQDGRPYRFMGLIYKDLMALVPSADHYRKALSRELPPRVREEIVIELAEVLILQTEFAVALRYLDECSFEVGGVPTVLPELRAECLYGLGRSAEAIRVLDQAPNSGPPSPRWLRLRAQLHADAGELRAAADLLQKALDADPHDCPCRYQLAQVYERLGRRPEAAEQRGLLEQSQRLYTQLGDLNQQAIQKPHDAGVRRRLAEVCGQLGKLDLAQMWLRAAAACPPPESPPSP